MSDRIQALQDQIIDSDSSQVDLQADAYWHDAIQLRKQLRRHQSRHKINHLGVLATYYALLFTVLSCFALALRGLVDWNGLIFVALLLFVFGVGALLIAIVVTLADIHLNDRPMRDEMGKLFNGFTNRTSLSEVHSRQRSKSRSRPAPSNNRKPRPKANAH
jgi:Protein of unknown function (DUF2721)